jgi:SAM-dependent methyltransferase
VWREVGDMLARDNGNLDAYLRESGTYSTVATLLTRLGSMDRSILLAKKILDVTAMTGGVTKHILEKRQGDAVVYANEISDGMMKKRDATLAEYIASGRCIPLSIDLSEPNSAESYLGPKELDIILWWGSFQIVAGRKMAINNAFDMLKEGGQLILMDVYPFNLADMGLGKTLGEDKARRLAYISKPFDMGKDTINLVTKQWGLKAMQERLTAGLRGAEVGQPRPIEIIEFGERLGQTRFLEMRCLCFTRPRTSKTERMPVLPREYTREAVAVPA